MRTQTTLSVEEQFERELEVFRTEAETATQFLYAFWRSMPLPGQKKPVYRLLNTAPLFVNGNRPVLRPQRYSVNCMRDRAAKNAKGGSVHERLVYEAERFLGTATESG